MRSLFLCALLAAGCNSGVLQIPTDPADLEVSGDFGMSPDFVELPDFAAPDLSRPRMPDLSGDMMEPTDVCCIADGGCYLIGVDGFLIPIDTKDAGEFGPKCL